MVKLIESPDVFGSTIFCDDVRMEISHKIIYIGVYQGAMMIHQAFPYKLPTFCFAVLLQQRTEIFNPKVTLRIFLPGDPDDAASDAASIVAEMGEHVSGAAMKHADDVSDKAGIPQADRKFVTMTATLQMQALEIKQPGLIKVRADIGENRYKLGGLSVVSPPP